MVPNRRRAAAADDVNRLFEQLALRFEALAGSDFTNVAIIDLSRAFHLQERAVTALALPPFQFYVTDIFDEKSPDDGNAFAFDPFFIARLVAVRRGCDGFRCLRFSHVYSEMNRRLIFTTGSAAMKAEVSCDKRLGFCLRSVPGVAA